MAIIVGSERLETISCYSCAILFAMPEQMCKRRLEDKHNFYCPNGHAQHFLNKSKEEQLRAELEIERNRADYNHKEYQRVARSLTAQRCVTTRIKNRIAAGVCPCCKRSFENLARHMKGQHPKYTEA